MEELILIGYGGHAKSVVDCIESIKKYQIIGYTDIQPCKSQYKYLGTDDVLKEYFDQGIKNAVVGIGYLGKGDLRKKLYEKLKVIGYCLPVIVDPSAIISRTAQIGEGTFIGKGAIVNAETVIGKMAIINTMALVEHECVVGDYTHIAVAAVLCGQVNVGSFSFVGANATIIQTICIPENTVVPAGFIVRGNHKMEKINGLQMVTNLGGGDYLKEKE